MLTGILIGAAVTVVAACIYSAYKDAGKNEPLVDKHDLSVNELQQMMKDCLAKEDYKEAAIIRDIIRQKQNAVANNLINQALGTK